MPVSTSVSQIIDAIEHWYPVDLADEWDQVGLIVGNPDVQTSGVLLSVDITQEILSQAVSIGANLVISHHPLDLAEVPGVITQPHIAELLHFAVTNNLILYSIHTNADNAQDGVSDAIMEALGAQSIGSVTNPTKIIGTGRYGRLNKSVTLMEFAKHVAAVLPENHSGIKVSGDLNRVINRVAVCGGSGAGLLPLVAQLDVDAYLTADLKHHAALDHRANSDIALVNVSHWASEWLWLAVLERKLNQEFPMLQPMVSSICTDPWQAEITSGNNS